MTRIAALQAANATLETRVAAAESLAGGSSGTLLVATVIALREATGNSPLVTRLQATQSNVSALQTASSLLLTSVTDLRSSNASLSAALLRTQDDVARLQTANATLNDALTARTGKLTDDLIAVNTRVTNMNSSVSNQAIAISQLLSTDLFLGARVQNLSLHYVSQWTSRRGRPRGHQLGCA